MKLFKTKYASLTTDELLHLAKKHEEYLPDVGRELLYRLEELYEEYLDAKQKQA